MATLKNRINNHYQELIHASALKIFLVFLGCILIYAAYFAVVLPKQFLFDDQVSEQAISVKQDRLGNELRSLIIGTMDDYAKAFLRRVEDGAAVYSYSLTSPGDATRIHFRVIPELTQVFNATVENGLLEFDLRLPPFSQPLKQVDIRPLLKCHAFIPASRLTDQQNDLIYCQQGPSQIVRPLTQYDFFYPQPPENIAPAQIVFSQLHEVMPLARALALNQAGHFGVELENFTTMLLLSAAIMTTNGTLGMEPATHHARLAVTVETFTGVLLLIWFLASRLQRIER